MNRNIILLLILLFPIFARGQFVQLDKSEFYKLKILKNKWIGSSEPNKSSQISFYKKYNQRVYKLKVLVDKYELDTLMNEIHISGFIKGGWYGTSSSVKIYIGTIEEKVDTIYFNPYDRADSTYVNGKLITEPTPGGTAVNMHLFVKSKFQTPDGFKNTSEKRPFDVSFKFSDKEKLVFALDGCWAEIYDLSKIK